MEPIRPTPLRAFRRDMDQSSNLKHSKSTTDVSTLSRTSSFLSFGGLEGLKSSALFGIFEKGGLDTEPQTPDPQSCHNFHFVDSGVPQSASDLRTNFFLMTMKMAGISVAAFAFISIFNRIPNKNRFCPISGKDLTNPLIYSVMATFIALGFPLLERLMATRQSLKKQISNPVPEQSNASAPMFPSSKDENRPKELNVFNVILRYFAGLLGLAYAGTKLDFSESSQFNICVAAITIATISILDRTLRGLIISVLMAVVISIGYVVAMRTPTSEILGVGLLIWFNVSIYGSLGKMLRIW